MKSKFERCALFNKKELHVMSAQKIDVFLTISYNILYSFQSPPAKVRKPGFRYDKAQAQA